MILEVSACDCLALVAQYMTGAHGKGTLFASWQHSWKTKKMKGPGAH